MSVELRPVEGSSQWPCCSELLFCGEAGWTPVTFIETHSQPPGPLAHTGLLPPPLPFLGAGLPPEFPQAILRGAARWPQGCGMLNPTPSLVLRGSWSSRMVFTPTLFLLRKESSSRELVFVPAFAVSWL